MFKKSHKWALFNVLNNYFDFTGANTKHGFILLGDKVNVLIVCKRLREFFNGWGNWVWIFLSFLKKIFQSAVVN